MTRANVPSAVALTLGLALIVALGLSLLAAHETIRNLRRTQRALFATQVLDAVTVGTRCGTPLTENGPEATETTQQELVKAGCLLRAGRLNHAAYLRLRRDVQTPVPHPLTSSLFPASKQIAPTTANLTVWAVLAAAELVGIGLLVVQIRRT